MTAWQAHVWRSTWKFVGVDLRPLAGFLERRFLMRAQPLAAILLQEQKFTSCPADGKQFESAALSTVNIICRGLFDFDWLIATVPLSGLKSDTVGRTVAIARAGFQCAPNQPPEIRRARVDQAGHFVHGQVPHAGQN